MCLFVDAAVIGVRRRATCSDIIVLPRNYRSQGLRHAAASSPTDDDKMACAAPGRIKILHYGRRGNLFRVVFFHFLSFFFFFHFFLSSFFLSVERSTRWTLFY